MIRDAAATDLENIYRLYQSHFLDLSKLDNRPYTSEIQKTGFMLGLETVEDIKERIKKDHIFRVFEQAGDIFGFINVNQEIYFPEDATNAVWSNLKAKEEYFRSQNSITLHTIAVSKDHYHQRIATDLLNSCIVDLKAQGFTNLFSITMLGPVADNASIGFHTKVGFSKVCVTKPADLFGIKNYESVLFCKELAP